MKKLFHRAVIFNVQYRDGKVKVSLCLIMNRTIKKYGGMEV
jgi:hypothetical protein